MKVPSQPPDEAVLREVFSEEPELVPFASSVIRHLANSGADGWDLQCSTERVINALRLGEGGEINPAIALLHSYPELLASFFQNADLLDPVAPSTARIAKAVLAGMQRLEGRSLDE